MIATDTACCLHTQRMLNAMLALGYLDAHRLQQLRFHAHEELCSCSCSKRRSGWGFSSTSSTADTVVLDSRGSALHKHFRPCLQLKRKALCARRRLWRGQCAVSVHTLAPQRAAVPAPTATALGGGSCPATVPAWRRLVTGTQQRLGALASGRGQRAQLTPAITRLPGVLELAVGAARPKEGIKRCEQQHGRQLLCGMGHDGLRLRLRRAAVGCRAGRGVGDASGGTTRDWQAQRPRARGHGHSHHSHGRRTPLLVTRLAELRRRKAVSEQAGRCGGGPTRCRSTSNAPPPPASADACKERPSLQWQQRQQLSSVGHEAEAKAEVEVGAEVEVEGDADAEAEAEAALSHLRANLEPFLHLSEAAEDQLQLLHRARRDTCKYGKLPVHLHSECNGDAVQYQTRLLSAGGWSRGGCAPCCGGGSGGAGAGAGARREWKR